MLGSLFDYVSLSYALTYILIMQGKKDLSNFSQGADENQKRKRVGSKDGFTGLLAMWDM